MEPTFTLPFSEWTVVNELEKHFKKTEGYTIAIPSSRQQKGFDLILYNSFSKKAITIQVKGSRTYVSAPPKRKTTTVRFNNYTWFNAFDVHKGLSDYYILFGLFVKTPEKADKTTRIKNPNWFDYVLLLYTEDEMIKFLSDLTLKRSDKKDKMFSFGFNSAKEIILVRGAKANVNYSEKILKTRVHELKGLLNPDNLKRNKQIPS